MAEIRAALVSEVLASHRDVARHTHRLLERLREFDLQRGYQPGSRSQQASSTVDWLSKVCGMPRRSAQNALATSYLLLNLPLTEAAFAAGELSYAKVRALASVATAGDEQRLVDVAKVLTEEQVRDYCCRLAARRQDETARLSRRRSPPARKGRLAMNAWEALAERVDAGDDDAGYVVGTTAAVSGRAAAPLRRTDSLDSL